MKMKLILSIIISTVVLVSCFKDRDTLGLRGDSGSIVTEIWDVNYYGAEKVLGLEATPPVETVTMVTLKVYSPRGNKPNGDVHVTLTLDPASTVTGAGLTPLPANGYSLPSLEFDVPSSGVLEVPITINKANLDLSKTYGIAFHISAVSQGVISELAKEIIVAILVKNAYDADYSTSGFFFHPSAPRALGPGVTKHISTLSATRIQAQLGDLGGYNFAVDVSGSTVSNFSAAPVSSMPAPPQSGLFTADRPANGPYPGPEQPGTAPYVHSTYNNTYDAATKTFWFHYGYGVGATAETGWSRQVYEKWVRK